MYFQLNYHYCIRLLLLIKYCYLRRSNVQLSLFLTIQFLLVTIFYTCFLLNHEVMSEKKNYYDRRSFSGRNALFSRLGGDTVFQFPRIEHWFSAFISVRRNVRFRPRIRQRVRSKRTDASSIETRTSKRIIYNRRRRLNNFQGRAKTVSKLPSKRVASTLESCIVYSC